MDSEIPVDTSSDEPIHPDINLTYGFINPDYGQNRVDLSSIRKKFDDFHNSLLREIVKGKTAEERARNLYAYNTHIGIMARSLDKAKDSFIKAKLAFENEDLNKRRRTLMTVEKNQDSLAPTVSKQSTEPEPELKRKESSR